MLSDPSSSFTKLMWYAYVCEGLDQGLVYSAKFDLLKTTFFQKMQFQ